MSKRIFNKNWLSLDTDPRKEVNHYRVYASYDVQKFTEDNKEYYAIENDLIDKFTMTWGEIEASGGVGETNGRIREKYNIAN